MGTSLSTSDRGIACKVDRDLNTTKLPKGTLTPNSQRCRSLGLHKSDLQMACCRPERDTDLGLMTTTEYVVNSRSLGDPSLGILSTDAVPSPSRCLEADADALSDDEQNGLMFEDCPVASESYFGETSPMHPCSNGSPAVAESYVGEKSPRGSRHGWGICSFADGSSYHGEWRHGEQHGIGGFLGPSEHHFGNYASGRRHGYGVALSRDGSRYEGDFQKGRATGQGARFFANGDSCLGDFVDGRLHGRGVFFWSSGDCFEGAFADSQRQNVGGVFFHDNGDVDVDLQDGESVGWSGDRARFWQSSGVPIMNGGDFEEVVEACSLLNGPSRECLAKAFVGPPKRPLSDTDLFVGDHAGWVWNDSLIVPPRHSII